MNSLKIHKGNAGKGRMGAYTYSLFRLFLLLTIGYLIIYPLLYMIITSISSPQAFKNSVRVWIPTNFAIVNNFKKALSIMEYGKSMVSTLKNEITSALIEVASCAFISYGFARFKFKGRNIFTALLFMSILVPDMIVIIPKTLGYSHLDFFGILGLFNRLTGIDLRGNIINLPLAFWLPSLLGVGLRSGILIYIYIQFFSGLPAELEEAAWVDGAGPIRTFFSIALPSSGVVIMTVTVFSLIWHWNDSLLCGMYLSDEYPLAMRLNMFVETMYQKYMIQLHKQTPEGGALLMAGCLLFVLPMLVVYMILQRRFIESIDRVGITG